MVSYGNKKLGGSDFVSDLILLKTFIGHFCEDPCRDTQIYPREAAKKNLCIPGAHLYPTDFSKYCSVECSFI
jgi:hypothetical protein